MKVVEVIPINRGIFKDRLSYFSSLPLEPGDLVDASVRNRFIPSLVTKVSEAIDIKLEIKKGDFELKKIEIRKRRGFIPRQLVEAAEAYSEYLVAPLGAVLKQFIPQAILNSSAGSGGSKQAKFPAKPLRPMVKPDRVAIQESDSERFGHYRSLIREAFAQNKSILVCVPTLPLAIQIREELGRGIKDYIGVLHSGLTAKVMIREWERLVGSAHPVVAIVTPIFISLPRRDWQAVIVERESSSVYRSQTRPFTDVRKFADFYTAKLGVKLIYGDSVLRVETIKLYGGKREHLLPLRHHAFSGAKIKIVDMTKETGVEPGRLPVISDDLTVLLDQAHQGGEKFFLYAHRRGLAPLIICQDCGSAFSCPECGATMILHNDRLFLCHRCGYGEDAETNCRACGSWRLKELGMGIEQVEKALQAISPSYNIFRIDSDIVKTPGQADRLIKKYYAATGGILVGTEMAMHYLHDKVENVAVVALDGLFTLPDFRVNERVFNLLIRLRTLATKRFLIQTRRPDHQLFYYASRGNLSDFYREEIGSRREFDYPPFRTLIKVSRRGEKTSVLAEINALAQELKEYEPVVYRALSEPVKNNYQLNLLLKLPPTGWPDAKILAKLKPLSPEFTVEVEPASIF